MEGHQLGVLSGATELLSSGRIRDIVEEGYGALRRRKHVCLLRTVIQFSGCAKPTGAAARPDGRLRSHSAAGKHLITSPLVMPLGRSSAWLQWVGRRCVRDTAHHATALRLAPGGSRVSP